MRETDPEFTQLVDRVFGPILEGHGFQKIEEWYDPVSFGNSLSTFESKEFRLRFFTDRSYYHIDVAPVFDVDEKWGFWKPLHLVFEFLGAAGCAACSEPAMRSDTWTEKTAECIDRNYVRLSKLFEEKGYQSFASEFDRFTRNRWLLSHPKTHFSKQ
jgi:hypothetical protein